MHQLSLMKSATATAVVEDLKVEQQQYKDMMLRPEAFPHGIMESDFTGLPDRPWKMCIQMLAPSIFFLSAHICNPCHPHPYLIAFKHSIKPPPQHQQHPTLYPSKPPSASVSGRLLLSHQVVLKQGRNLLEALAGRLGHQEKGEDGGGDAEGAEEQVHAPLDADRQRPEEGGSVVHKRIDARELLEKGLGARSPRCTKEIPWPGSPRRHRKWCGLLREWRL